MGFKKMLRKQGLKFDFWEGCINTFLGNIQDGNQIEVQIYKSCFYIIREDFPLNDSILKIIKKIQKKYV